MRNNHNRLPEILDAYERNEHYFCSVAITIEAETKVFEFGIDRNAYRAIKRIFNLRPFERFPGVSYRYFFSPTVRQQFTEIRKFYCNVRVEQGEKGKEFEVEAPKSLISNLLWFFEIKEFKEAAHLKEIIQER